MPDAQPKRLAVVVPTYRPENGLTDFIRQLLDQQFAPVIVVDDGSGPDFGDLFGRIGALPGVEVLRHAARLGIGAAIKTGINSALCQNAGLTGILTANPDSRPADIARMADKLVAGAAEKLLEAPGVYGIPAAIAPEVLKIEANGPEFATRLPGASGVKSRGRRGAAASALAIFAVFLGGLALELHGLLNSNLYAQDIWEDIGVKRFLRYIGMFLGIAFPLLAMVPWTFPSAIATLTVVGTVFAIGPLALLSVVLYLVSSCALGSRLLGRKHGDSVESQLFSTLLGAALWILLMTLIARLPLNYPAVWAALLAIPVLLDWRGAWRRLERCWQVLRGAELRRYPERISFALLAFVLLAHWFVALMPETSADGLAMHLAVALDIAAHHQMTYQPARVLWAVMPMGADFSYAIVSLLGGEYAAHLLDYALLLIVVAVLYFAIRRWVCAAAAFGVLALFVSTPMVQLVTGSLFIENMLAAMIVGMVAALARFSATGEKRYLYLTAAFAGTALSVKFGALPFVAIAIVFLAMEVAMHWKALGSRTAACALAAMLFIAMAAPPYAIAYVKTGNPLFPFLYDKIPTPLIPRDAGIVDERFKRPLTWSTLYDLTFHSHLTYEGRDGSFGFQYLILAPLGVAGLLVARRRREAGAAAAVALGAAAIIMWSQPNARYLYAALPLLSIPFAAVLAWAADKRQLYRAMVAFTVGTTLLNIRFLPSASYYHRDFCLRLPFSRAERQRFRDSVTPIRAVIDYFNRAQPHATALFTADSSIAGFHEDFYENHWHQINTLLALRQARTALDVVHLMQSWHVGFFISPKPGSGIEIKPASLEDALQRCSDPVYEHGNEYLARLDPDCRPAKQQPMVVVQAGTYDDFDPALVYRGDWTKSRGFREPDQHTVSYTDIVNSDVEIAFEGRALTYVYTKASNRGIASVVVDGVDQGEVDLYSADTQWQKRTRFCCFAPGRHVAVVRVTGKADPQSKGKFIDLDSFVVE